jgi:hypothetical protein
MKARVFLVFLLVYERIRIKIRTNNNKSRCREAKKNLRIIQVWNIGKKVWYWPPKYFGLGIILVAGEISTAG